MASSEPAGWATAVEHLRSRTRAARGTPWFPLTLFGVEALASSPLYVQPDTACPDGRPSCASLDPSPLSVHLPGGLFTANPAAIGVFWLVAAPLGYLATGAFYRARARRRGVGISTTSYVLTGLGLLALLVASTTVGETVLGDLFIRGLTPLITVAIGLFVLARAQRSRPLAIFAVAFLGLVLLANLYDMQNLTYRMGLGSTGDQTNVIVVGAALVLAGAGFGIAELLARRRAA
jgi:hypothetical protein